jgi:hypothetical protein
MNDPLLDDVKSLLDKDFGDDRILKQICRACENNEVISNYEKNYVRKLAEKHLGKKPEIIPTQSEEKNVVLDVKMPQITPVQETQTLRRKPVTTSKSKNTKMVVGIGAVALVIIIAVGVSFSGMSDGLSKIDSSNNAVPISLLIQTDLSSYSKKDLISISGVSDTSGTVNLSIVNQNNKLVWTEQVSLKNNGKYSTLAIAGGPGWESSGTYTVKVDNGVKTKSSTFSFTA